jgi:hypothetical protein
MESRRMAADWQYRASQGAETSRGGHESDSEDWRSGRRDASVCARGHWGRGEDVGHAATPRGRDLSGVQDKCYCMHYHGLGHRCAKTVCGSVG